MINVREVRLAAGAEFVVMVCGDIMTMPGLPKVPVGGENRPDRRRQGRGLVLEPRAVRMPGSTTCRVLCRTARDALRWPRV